MSLSQEVAPESSQRGSAARAGWYKRLFAWVMARGGQRHDLLVAERKRALLGDLHGDVLEIGPGAGPNLAYYPRDVRWIGVEPNPYMHAYLRKAAGRRGLAVDIRLGTAEHLNAADQSVDAVVSTLVLCSVADPAAALREVLRVLKPGGRFVFVEHVAAPRGTRLRRFQSLILPLWSKVGDGCQLDRETWRAIEQAGFAQAQIEHFDLPTGPVAPHIAGVAIKQAV